MGHIWQKYVGYTEVNLTCNIIYLENVKDKKVVMYGFQLIMDEIKKWKAEQKYALENLPNMTKRESQYNYMALMNFQSASTSL
jgi:hypothetical protein